MPNDLRPQFSLADLLIGLLVLTTLVGLTVPAYFSARKQSLKSDCKGNLKQLGNYLTLYVSRYGSDWNYPSTSPPGGSGAPVPAGPNGAFWSHLYRLPNQTNACSQRPGDCSFYICDVHLGKIGTPTALEYTAPIFAATWPSGLGADSGRPIYPGGKLSEATRGDAPVGGDLIGPTDVPNHGGRPGAPNDDWNMMCFDGHVESVVPGSVKHILYVTATAGVRTT
ncbi:MAG: hypothetical protein HZA54_19100 [Planctomycetes bacterium]|nr:hypothetical protein [Planctomycetota bacterium]